MNPLQFDRRVRPWKEPAEGRTRRGLMELFLTIISFNNVAVLFERTDSTE